MNEMETVRTYVNQGLSLRAKAALKVRQPLASVTVPKLGDHVDFEPILKDELNVKKVIVSKNPVRLTEEDAKLYGVAESEVIIDRQLTPQLKREGMMREVVRVVQAARKDAGLNVDDRIELSLTTYNNQLKTSIKEHSGTIKAETLASTLTDSLNSPLYQIDKVVEGANLNVSLKKK
jgi:isoleucyl-tRNA synthetase